MANLKIVLLQGASGFNNRARESTILWWLNRIGERRIYAVHLYEDILPEEAGELAKLVTPEYGVRLCLTVKREDFPDFEQAKALNKAIQESTGMLPLWWWECPGGRNSPDFAGFWGNQSMAWRFTREVQANWILYYDVQPGPRGPLFQDFVCQHYPNVRRTRRSTGLPISVKQIAWTRDSMTNLLMTRQLKDLFPSVHVGAVLPATGVRILSDPPRPGFDAFWPPTEQQYLAWFLLLQHLGCEWACLYCHQNLAQPEAEEIAGNIRQALQALETNYCTDTPAGYSRLPLIEGSGIPGDLDGDADVDMADAIILSHNYTGSLPPP